MSRANLYPNSRGNPSVIAAARLSLLKELPEE